MPNYLSDSLQEAFELDNDFENYCQGEDKNAPVWKFIAKFGERNEMSRELEAQVHAWTQEDAKNIISNEGGFSIRLIEKPSESLFEQCKNKVKNLFGDEVANSLG